MSANYFFQPLGTFPFQQAQQRIPLLTKVNLHALIFRVTATVDVAAGGGADGAVIAEGVQRLIDRVRVNLDGDSFVQGISGRDLFQFMAYDFAGITAAANLAGAGIATTAISFTGVLPFSRNWLQQPILTCVPGSINPTQELALYMDWFTGAANATSAANPGTGAFYTGGTRLVSFTVAPQVEITQVYSTGNVVPWFFPRITTRVTEQVNAANTQLPLLITNGLPFDSVLFEWRENVDQRVAANINRMSFIAGGGAVQFFNRVDFTTLQRVSQGYFPASVTASQVGRLFQRFADNGALGSAVDPRQLQDPRFVFDVAAPGVNPGFVRGVFMELQAKPGITRVPPTPARGS